MDSSADNDDDSDDNNDDDRRAFQDINRGWPVEAHYTPIRRDARNLSIMKQPQPMKRMIRAAVNQVTEHFLFDSAYPAAEQVEFDTFHHDVFIQCSKHLKYTEITKRLKVDDELVKLCTRVVWSLIMQTYYVLMTFFNFRLTLVSRICVLAQRGSLTRRLRDFISFWREMMPDLVLKPSQMKTRITFTLQPYVLSSHQNFSSS